MEVKNWTVEDVFELRKRLFAATRIDLSGGGEPLLFTGKSLCSNISRFPQMCPTHLDLDRIARYTRASLQNVRFRGNLAFHSCPISLPNHVRSLELVHTESNDLAMSLLCSDVQIGGIASFHHLSELTLVSPYLTWSQVLKVKMPNSIVSLTLQLPRPKLLDISIFNDNLPSRLLHLSLGIMPRCTEEIHRGPNSEEAEYESNKELDWFLADLPSLPPFLRTLHAKQLKLVPDGFELLKSSLTKLEFAGGRDWTDTMVMKLLRKLRDRSASQPGKCDTNLQFEHLSLECATLSGSLLPTDVEKVDWNLFKSSAENALGSQVTVKLWYVSLGALAFPSSLLEIDLLIEAEPKLTYSEEESQPEAPSDSLLDSISSGGRQYELRDFSPLPPTLTTLQLSVGRLKFFHFSCLPHSLTHLSVSYKWLEIVPERWNYLPRRLKALKLWKANREETLIFEDRGVGLPPELETCYLPDFLFVSTAISYLPKSLTQICAQKNQALFSRMNWVQFFVAPAPPRQKTVTSAHRTLCRMDDSYRR